MKKDYKLDISEELGHISHDLKSPITTIKALLFIFSKNKDEKSRKKTLDKIDNKLNVLNLKVDEIVAFLQLFSREKGIVEFFNLEKELSDILGKFKGNGLRLKIAKQKEIIGRKEIVLNALETILKRVINISDPKIMVTLTKAGVFEIVYETTTQTFPSVKEDKDNWLKLYVARKSLENQNVKIRTIKKNNTTVLKMVFPQRPKN